MNGIPRIRERWNAWAERTEAGPTPIYHLQISIPATPPTLNILLRMHWRARRRLEDDFYLRIKKAAMNIEIPPARKGEQRALKILCLMKNDADRDNLWGGAKPLIDAIKKASWIFDDDDRHLVVHVDRETADPLKNPETVIDLFYNERRDDD